MRPQHGASRHDARNAECGEQGQDRSICPEYAPSRAFAPCFAEEKHGGGRGPVDGTRPVADKGEQTHGGHVEVGDAVVGIGQVDRRDGVGAAKGEERCVLEEEGGDAEFRDRELPVVEEFVLEMEEEEEGDVGGSRLCGGQEGVEVVDGLDRWSHA